MDDRRRDTGSDGQEENGVTRRQFVRTMGAAGALGAAGGAVGIPRAGIGRTRSLWNGQQTTEFPVPEGLQPGAQSDSRFPVSFHEPVSQGMRLMVDYFTALNQRDLLGVADTLHFPFALYEDIEPVVVESAEQLLDDPPATLVEGGGGNGTIMPGSYDLLDNVGVEMYCPVGGVFTLGFTRYTPDGHKLLECEGIYAVTNNNGRWAIEMGSTVLHERGYEDLVYPQAEEMHLLGDQGYLAAFGYRDTETLDNPQIGRGSYTPPLPPGTRAASVSFGYGARERTRNARAGRPMAGWRVDGVESRLRVREATEPGAPGSVDTDLDEFVDLAGQTVGQYGYTRSLPYRPAVIHATHDKGHVRRGYRRFTPAGELISETRSIAINVYVEGAWRGSGGMGQVTHHDRSNSVG